MMAQHVTLHSICVTPPDVGAYHGLLDMPVVLAMLWHEQSALLAGRSLHKSTWCCRVTFTSVLAGMGADTQGAWAVPVPLPTDGSLGSNLHRCVALKHGAHVTVCGRLVDETFEPLPLQ